MFVVMPRVIDVYSVFPVRAIDALLYIIYISMVRVTLVVEVCDVIELVYVAAFHFLSICEMTTCSKCATQLWWWPPSVHVPRCRLRQFSNSCPAVLLGLGLGLGSVLVYSVSVKIATKTSIEHFFLKIKTWLLSTPPLISFPKRHRYVLKWWVCQPLAYKAGKYDMKWSISSTTNAVCMFFTGDMMTSMVQWSLAWFDTYMYSSKNVMN